MLGGLLSAAEGMTVAGVGGQADSDIVGNICYGVSHG